MFGQVKLDLIHAFYKVASVRPVSVSVASGQILLVTIAFNNPVVIAIQIILLRRFLLDDYVLIVADNSSRPQARTLLGSVCEKLGTQYVSIPRFPLALGPSESHAMALNWVNSNIFLPSKAAYFGFLDHDIYPFCKTSIMSFFNEFNAIGLKQERKNLWYLWPGFVFFNNLFLQSAKVDFRPDPKRALDTGGRLYFSHNYQRRQNEILFLKEKYFYSDAKEKKPQISTYSLIEDWIHTRNGSYWTSCSPREDAIIHFLSRMAKFPNLQNEVARVLS